MIQDLKRHGLEKPEHTEFLTVGYKEMDLFSEEEFNAELKKFREERHEWETRAESHKDNFKV